MLQHNLTKSILVPQPLGRATDAACLLLNGICAENRLVKKPEGMASRNDATIYRVQGANAQEICPMAFDCEGTSAYPIPKEVLANIQKGVKSTGRASTFVRASGHISNVEIACTR